MGIAAAELSTEMIAIYISVCVGLVLFAGLCSGLTLGLFSINVGYVRAAASTHDDTKLRRRCRRLLPLLSRNHLLLVTLLTCNAGAMTALPVFLERLLDPLTSLLVSVTAVLLFGEVLPQAVFVKNAIPIGSFFREVLWVLIGLTCVISYPFGRLLDRMVGHKEQRMQRDQYGAFFSYHKMANDSMTAGDGNKLRSADGVEQPGAGPGPMRGGELSTMEVGVMRGALALQDKKVRDIMKVEIDRAFMLPISAKLDPATVERIVLSGFSRVPVYVDNPSHSKNHIVGVLLVKKLLRFAFTSPDPPPLLTSLMTEPGVIAQVVQISEDEKLETLFDTFKYGVSHMAIVKGRHEAVAGIVTFEDLLEELHQQTFTDETDLDGASPIQIHMRHKELMDVYKTVKIKRNQSKVALDAMASPASLQKPASAGAARVASS